MRTVYALLDPRTQESRYVGITAQRLNLRYRTHIGQARLGRPQPVSCWIRDLLALGLEPQIVTLEETEDSSRELHWIEHLTQAGYELLNITPSANAHWRGRTLSDEHRAAIGAALKGRVKTVEHRAALSTSLTGKPKSQAHRLAMSIQRKGRLVTPEQRAKISAALKGRSKSPEHVAKVAASNKGKHSHGPLSPEHRAKISVALKGKPRS